MRMRVSELRSHYARFFGVEERGEGLTRTRQLLFQLISPPTSLPLLSYAPSPVTQCVDLFRQTGEHGPLRVALDVCNTNA